MRNKKKHTARNFEVTVNGETMDVTAKQYEAAHALPRFRVSVNDSPVHIFGMDPAIGKIIVLDSATQKIEPSVEKAICRALAEAIAA